MVPYANFTIFGWAFLYIVLPSVMLGLLGKFNTRWSILAMLVALGAIFSNEVIVNPSAIVPEIWIAGGFAVYQAAIGFAFLRWRSRPAFYAALTLSILPLAAAKFVPLLPGENAFGFIGISYVTFRALDVIFSIQDKVLTTLSPTQYLAYVFFFPVISSGPVDRYRRFSGDWNRIRGQHEFLEDLDAFIQRLFQGFLYKYIIAALLKTYWLDAAAIGTGFLPAANYMYAYTFYLFFDFAGYTAFAIAFSRLFGIRSPENFDKPFLSKNIRDFWNRWHISLSYWFRDHIYMRFLLAAGKGKWFKGKHTASYLGLFLTFGIMGVWHGLERYYIIYGIYHAALLCGYDAFARWNKQAKFWRDGRIMRMTNIVLTFHAIAFGLLIFSGHLFPKPLPKQEAIAEVIDCHEVSGWVWDAKQPDTPLAVDLYIDEAYIERITASELREERRAHGYGNGAHGFTYKLPDYVRDGRPHIIEVKIAGTDRTLKGAPETVTCEAGR